MLHYKIGYIRNILLSHFSEFIRSTKFKLMSKDFRPGTTGVSDKVYPIVILPTTLIYHLDVPQSVT